MTWEGLTPPYATIVADPPWHYDGRVVCGAARPMPYATMSTPAIQSLSVAELAAPGAHLYLWTTQAFLFDAPRVMSAWGFEAQKVLTWCKTPMGVGVSGSFANTTEFVVFGRRRVGALVREARERKNWTQGELERQTRGKATRLIKRWEDDDCFPDADSWTSLAAALELPADLVASPRQTPTTWWNWPRRGHSVKPYEFFDVVEQASPGPYVELFARAPRLGWDHWGYGYESERVS